MSAMSVPRRWATRCTAHRTNGEPCRAWSIRGGYVCRSHGGSTKRVRAAAELRWAEARATRALMDRMAARMEQTNAEVEAIRRAAR